MNNYDTDIMQDMLGALDGLCDKYLANRGTEHEFVSCITPDKKPWYWVRAEQAVERAKRFIERKESRKREKNSS